MEKRDALQDILDELDVPSQGVSNLAVGNLEQASLDLITEIGSIKSAVDRLIK